VIKPVSKESGFSGMACMLQKCKFFALRANVWRVCMGQIVFRLLSQKVYTELEGTFPRGRD